MSEKENGHARTYKDSGVDIDTADRAKDEIKRLVRRTFNKNVLADVGLFGGLFKFDKDDYISPVLVSSADGVGTKLKIAFMTRRHSTVGQCLVNHCVNDILAQGAKPLFFLDYIASGRLVPETVASIVEGLAVACEENGCALIGGETAEMPDFYKDDEYDLAGFIIGVVEQDQIINGSGIREGDIIIGLSSNGMHTNGYSLARKVLFDDLKLNVDDHIPEIGRSISEELLRVHRSYLKPVSSLLEKQLVSGIAHITGGGFEGNISRVMPEGLSAEVDTKTWEPLPIFRFIQEKGRVAPEEMYRVFNMGIGMVILMKREALGETEVLLKKAGQDFKIIGKVITGKKPVRLLGI
jgi:phosphoribosylformylglycinamidine cyclo-ligase